MTEKRKVGGSTPPLPTSRTPAPWGARRPRRLDDPDSSGRLKRAGDPVEIQQVTQPRDVRQPARVLLGAVRSASRAALVMSVVAVAVIAADAAVAVSRTAGRSAEPHQAAVVLPQRLASTQPGVGVSPTRASASHSSPAERAARIGSAKTLLAAAFATALAKGSVHAVARTVSPKIGTAIFDDYDATTGGVQHISIYGGHVTVRVVGPKTYFKGDMRGLTRYLGFTPDEVAVLHHQWLPLTRGQAGYQAVTEGVTMASMLHEDRIVAPLRLLPEQTVDGVPAVGVRGRATGAGAPRHAVATLWVSTGENPLPVEFVATNRRIRLTQTFSDWGRPIHLAAPANVFGDKTVAG